MKGVRALVIAVALFFVLAPVVSAKNGVLITINGSANPFFLSQRTVSDAQDVPTEEVPATTRRADGVKTVDPRPGTKLATVLELAGLPRFAVDSVSIKRVSLAGTVVIDAHHLVDGFDGEEDGITRYAVINAGYGHGVSFFRPVDSDTDVNASDYMTTANDEDLPISVRTPNETTRRVIAWVDDATIAEGEAARFGASVDQPPPGVSFTYTWDFGDGATGSGDRPDHQYPAAPGSYTATVTAVGDDQSAGVSPPVYVQVGEPAAPTPTPTSSASPTPTPGGATGGGGTAGGGEGDKKSRTSGPKQSKGKSDQRKRGSKRSKAEATATATPAASATATASPAATASAEATPSPSPSPTATPTAEANEATPAETATPSPAQAAPVARGERVEGILLAGAGSIEDAIQAARSAEPRDQDRSQARRGGGGGGASIAGWVGGSTGLIALLALGVLREGGFRVRRRFSLT